MPILMKGNPLVKEMLNGIFYDNKKQVCIFTNEDDPASAVYVRNKTKKFAEVGINTIVFQCAKKSKIEVVAMIERCREEKIPYMFQLPMAPHLVQYEEEFTNGIPFELDMDSMSLLSQGKFYNKPELNNTPCTPEGILRLLTYYIKDKNSLFNTNVVVVGRSAIVGRPIARLLEYKLNSTVTICHSKTKNLKEITRRADIVIVAVGRANFLTADMVKDGAIIVDVGINRDENGKLVGDVKADSELMEKVSAITPVPGGVGPMTVGSLVIKTIEKMK